MTKNIKPNNSLLHLRPIDVDWSPQKIYWYHTLGLHQVLLPPTKNSESLINPPSPAPWEWEGDPHKAHLVVYTHENRDSEKMVLLQRILASIQIHHFILLKGQGKEDELRQISSTWKLNTGLIFGQKGLFWDLTLMKQMVMGERVHFAGIEWLILHSLSSLLGDDENVRNRKRETWMYLKTLL